MTVSKHFEGLTIFIAAIKDRNSSNTIVAAGITRIAHATGVHWRLWTLCSNTH